MTAGPGAAHHDVVITTLAFDPAYKAGGPIKSVAEVLDNIRPEITCLVITSDRDLGDVHPFPDLSGKLVNRGRHQIYYLDRSRVGHWLRALRLVRAAHPEVLYLNSFWSPYFTFLPILATLCRLIRPRRVLLAPRGEFAPGALALKARKKRLMLPLWSAATRLVRPTIQASSPSEADLIRQSLPWTESSIILQNSLGPAPEREVVAPGTSPRLVYIGRVARIKNVKLSLEALELVPTGLSLDIYGTIEDPAYWSECLEVIGRLPEHVTVHYRGELEPRNVRPTFAQYDAFVMPTAGENFGHAIAESLSAGCPVLCSTATPWSSLLRAGGGAAVDSFDHRAWAKEIDRWARLTAPERMSAKEAALHAYAEWRTASRRKLAVEDVIDGRATDRARSRT